MSWLFEHEIAHLNFAHYGLSMVKKWIKYAGSLDPISQYSRAWLYIGTEEFVERMNDCKMFIDLSRMKTLDNDEQILYYVLKAGFVDAINNAGGSVKDNSIINAARREYVTGLDIYSNEQHSEFYGNPLWKITTVSTTKRCIESWKNCTSQYMVQARTV